MYVFLAIIIIIAAILLIGAVLIQKSKGGGLASNYAGGNQYMGYRKTTDFIEKATWSLAIIICVLSICCSFAVKSPTAAKSAIVTEQTQQTKAAPGRQGASAGQQQAPAQQAPAQQQPSK
ncbi:MAG: preprotein translocase subunit SecG [Prevotella sp.]|nr:preprotein translocase subunit SecG [Prevotella sp.]MCM1074500.1 preprotein translocase subunit SecG [Ruminococcus sp.]